MDQQKPKAVSKAATFCLVVLIPALAFGHTEPPKEGCVQPVRPPSDTELLSTLFDLGREVTSVLELEELLAKIPQLIARLTRFNAFSVYLLDDARHELRIAYAVGYPDDALATQRLRVGQGVVGAAVEEGRPILVNDIRREPRYQGPLRNMLSQLAVPRRCSPHCPALQRARSSPGFSRATV